MTVSSHRKRFVQSLDDFRWQVLFVGIKETTAKPTGQTAKRRHVLAGLLTIDQSGATRITHAHHQGARDGARQARQRGIRQRFAIADDG